MSGWLVLALVLLLLALLAVGLFLWWRSKGGEAVRAFYLTVRQMEQDQDVVDRYEVPWFLLLGDPLLGERFGLDWGLTAAGRPAWFGRWWADQDGAVLAEEGAATSPRAWRRLLSLLLRLRPRRPLDGVVWVLPVQRLLDPASLAQENLQLRRRFNDLLQRLGLGLPVYVVVTGLEELEGFAELRAQLPEDARERPLGWSSAVQIDAAWQDDHLERGFEQVLQALQASILEAGVLKGQLSDALYRFPIALASLRDGLRQRLGPVFQGNALGEAPRLRGLYFSGACRNADSDPWSISALEAAPAQQVFTRGLWQSRLLAERGLAQAVSRDSARSASWARWPAWLAWSGCWACSGSGTSTRRKRKCSGSASRRCSVSTAIQRKVASRRATWHAVACRPTGRCCRVPRAGISLPWYTPAPGSPISTAEWMPCSATWRVAKCCYPCSSRRWPTWRG